MSSPDNATDPELMDRWLPYLSPQDCDAAIRLAGTMVEAGLMAEAEATEWSVESQRESVSVSSNHIALPAA